MNIIIPRVTNPLATGHIKSTPFSFYLHRPCNKRQTKTKETNHKKFQVLFFSFLDLLRPRL